MISIGFTGTRKGMSLHQIRVVATILSASDRDRDITVHHGDCVGADEQFHHVAAGYVQKIVIHPPLDVSHRAWECADESRTPKPYLERNHDIVDESELMIATPNGFSELLRSGTWATIRYARKLKRSLMIIYPDGSVVKEGS